MEEDGVKYLSERFFVNESSIAMHMTKRYGAVGTSHQLQNGSFPSDCVASADQPTNQPTNNQKAKGGNLLLVQVSVCLVVYLPIPAFDRNAELRNRHLKL